MNIFVNGKRFSWAFSSEKLLGILAKGWWLFRKGFLDQYAIFTSNFFWHFIKFLELKNVLEKSIVDILGLGLKIQFLKQAKHIKKLVINDKFLNKFRVVKLIDKFKFIHSLLIFVLWNDFIIGFDHFLCFLCIYTFTSLGFAPDLWIFLSELSFFLLFLHLFYVLGHYLPHFIPNCIWSSPNPFTSKKSGCVFGF